MACPSPWKDIEDKFFECSICLDLFKEPKQLPCLHRFCKQCLESLLEGQVGTFECLLCKDVCKIPNNRIDGFKTDFHMKSMLQFIQLQKTFENRRREKCIGCEEKLKVTAYCFMCLKNFFVSSVINFILTKKIFAKHQKHVLGLNDLERKSLTQKKLASLMEAPRCHTHPEHKAKLCCCTCGNLPVCVTCTYGKHKGHDIQDVANVSKEERERLQKRLEELVKQKENVASLTNKINKVNAELTSIVADTQRKWKTQYEDQTRKLKNKKKKVKREFNRFKTVLEERSRKELKELESEMEEKIRKIREDYDRMIKMIIWDSKEKEDTKRNEIVNRELRIDETMNKLDAQMNERNKTIDEQQQQKLRETQNLSDLCNQWVNKFENVSTIASSVLESHNHWTDAQCIPDIRAASEPLVEDIMKDFPEIESLSDITMDDLPMLCIDIVNISDNVESVVDADVIKGTSIGSLFIFDEELKFIRALKLPEVMNWSRDILYHEGVLLICDKESRCAYAVTMDTSKTEAELLYKLPKPDIDGKTWYPWSICADRAGFVYILWDSAGKRIITQYSQDGQQLLTTKWAEDTAWCMTTLMTEEGEKLLVATSWSGKILCYGLLE
ncbi:hypothetical protein BSL78_21596 [Apostichopus japonicus]|uniref:RING-type domain-containing protein n=1 Tax=Stichopus japonicus TaxID=307972 RepID=A0A2G8K0R5_STIJA|nr:hypothetical protein BSL78_21596 [Apostichopus japonicus]